MGNECGKGVLLEGEGFPEGVWTHLAVSVEGRKVFYCSWLLMAVDRWETYKLHAVVSTTKQLTHSNSSPAARSVLQR